MIRALNTTQCRAVVCHGAVVAEDDVVTFAGCERIASSATHHDVVAAASCDGVHVAVSGVARGHAGQRAGAVCDTAVVADCHVVSITRGDVVGAIAGEDHVETGSGGDGVVAAQLRSHGAEMCSPSVRRYCCTVIAQHDVIAVGYVDDIAADATGHEVVPVARVDHVVAARTDGGRGHRLHDAGLDLDLAIVADNHIVASLDGDRVAGRATNNDVVADARGDLVGVAGGRICTLDERCRAICIGHCTVIAQDDVVAVASVDLVSTTAAEHDVRAVRGEDEVVAAMLGISCGDAEQRAPAVHVVEDGFAVVTHDHVRAGVRADALAGLAVYVDVVGTDSAEDHVVAVADEDIVVAVEDGFVVVAEDDGVVFALRHVVAVGVADDNVVSALRRAVAIGVPDGNAIVAARRGHGSANLSEHTFVVEDGFAIVADHDVASRVSAGVDVVTAAAAEDHVRAVASEDRVHVALIRVGRLDAPQQARALHRVKLSKAVIADDHVRTSIGAGVDVVLALTAEYHVVAVAGDDLVVAAGGRHGRTDVDQGLVLTKRGLAVVANHDVTRRIGASVDLVGATAAHDHVRSVRGEDEVVAAILGIGGGDAQQRTAAVHVVEGGFAVVTDDHVRAGVRADAAASVAVHIDVVRTDSSEDYVVAVAHKDIVVAAGGRIGSPDLSQHAFAVEDALAVVANHDVTSAISARVDVVAAAAAEDHV